MSDEDTKTLFLKYTNIFNVALTKHRETVIYKQILDLAEKMLEDKIIGIEVSSESTTDPVVHFSIRFNAGTFDVVSHDKEESELIWKFKATYLKKVVENSHDYVEHPEKFEWDWLKSYLGMEK